MNCVEIRRQLLADPETQNDVLQQHVQQCPECARFARDLMAFESGLAQASKVDVPEGLASRILLRQRLSTENIRGNKMNLARAAILVLGVAAVLAGILNLGVEDGFKSLDQVVLHHVNDELQHLDDHYDLSLKQVNSVLQKQGSKLEALPGRRIQYAGACQIRRTKGAHMVVSGDSGPLTVLFMPGEFVDKRSQLEDKRFKGVIIPTQQGSIAIVGEDPRQIEQLERELKAHVVDLS